MRFLPVFIVHTLHYISIRSKNQCDKAMFKENKILDVLGKYFFKNRNYTVLINLYWESLYLISGI